MSATSEKEDASTIESLEAIKADHAVMLERLQTMEAKKSSVPEAVYKKVSEDYHTRAAELVAKAAPLEKALHARFRTLQDAVKEFSATCSAADLERQENEFRHELGEFDDAEFKSRTKAIEESLGKTRQRLEKTEALMARIREAFLDSAALDKEAAPETTSTAEALDEDGSRTQPMDAVDDKSTQPGTKKERPELASTQIMPPANASNEAKSAPPVKPGSGASTTVLRTAKLVPQNLLAGRQAHLLSLRPAILGRTESCDIRIGGDQVAERHARITVSAQGFTLEDLGSSIGTLVNGERVTSRLLANEDQILVGAARLVFKDK